MRAKLIFFAMIVMGLWFQSCDDEDDSRPVPAAIDFEVINVSEFNGNDGSIAAIIAGGEAPFYYYWNTGDTTQTIDSLRAGIYTLRLTYGTDGSGYAEKAVEVVEPEAEPLNISFDVVDASKYAKPWGAVEVIVKGGTPPYHIEWSNGASTAKIEDLYAGTYIVKVEDSSSPLTISAIEEVYVGEADFVCGQDSIMDIDGNYYGTIELAGKCWTVDNLKTAHNPAYPDSLVPIEGRYCNSEKNFCNLSEGPHYTWEAVMNGEEGGENVQGIAPEGWRIPSKQEWQELRDWLNVDGNGGNGTNGWKKVMGENSSSGLDFLPAGNWGYGIFSDPEIAAFWSSDSYSEEKAEGIYLLGNANIFFQRFNFTQRPKIYGLSVRCVKDINE